MLKELKMFVTDGIPTEDDVKEALSYAKKNDCWVRIVYTAFGWPYKWTIDPADTFEEVWENRRKVYGL